MFKVSKMISSIIFKSLIALLLAPVICIGSIHLGLMPYALVHSLAATAPYDSYTYNYYTDAVPIPAPYIPEIAVSGREIGSGEFLEPQDLYITEAGIVHILDSGNNRIIITDGDWKLLRIINAIEAGGRTEHFNNPRGIFVTEDGVIYVADTGNNRIVALTGDGTLLKIIADPQSEILPAGFTFTPLKLTVDQAGRVYVVARGVFEGLMQFDADGMFLGYAGTINMTQRLWDRIWRALATDEQRRRMQLYIPTEFVSVDIDHKGFVYSTNIDNQTRKPIKRLNPSGEDVLKRFGHHEVIGDIRYRNFGSLAGPSQLIDIKVLGDGMYTVLDGLRGRIFTYNHEGELLHVFGAFGTQIGTFRTPVAVEQLHDRLVVLDRGKNHIIVYRPTRFGSKVREAVHHQYHGEAEAAAAAWREVLKMNANYDIAYIGIGKSLLLEQRNDEAMEYFALGMERKYYSIAYQRHRREEMKRFFPGVMSALIAAIACYTGCRIWRRQRDKGKGVHLHETG